MSKQRPSRRHLKLLESAASLRHRPDSIAFWRRRVFRNTYTRGGRTKLVGGWSVKIQHQGRRQTFSLVAASKTEAAKEARSLYRIVRTDGWDAASPTHRRTGQFQAQRATNARRDELSKSDVRYWRERLIHSKYREAQISPINEFSVRMEHEGAYQYFPLGTDDEERAAMQALNLYQTILTNGWEAAFRQFSREITVAIFWSTSPVACTYTTLFTFPEEVSPSLLPLVEEARPRKTIGILESDPEVSRTLVFWLNRQPGFKCACAFKTALDAQNSIVHEPPDLFLVNRALPEMPVAEFLEHLRIRLPDLPAFQYGIYQDSDQIFVTLSGVTAGYIFRRRKPIELFEPIRVALRQKILAAKEVFLRVRDYFQSLFGFTRPGEETQALASLTAREQEILNHLSKGFLDKEIASALSISIWTVHNHLKHIYEKLGVHTRTEAVLKYLQK